MKAFVFARPVLAWLLCLPTLANAADPLPVTVGDLMARYERDPGSRAIIARHLGDMQDAFGWANADLEVERHEAPFYCVPEKLALTSAQVIDILRRQAATDRLIDSDLIGFGLLQALEATFPCKK